MIDHERLWRVLRRFASTLHEAAGLDEVVAALGEEIVAILGVSGAGFMLEDGRGDLRFLAASDPVLKELERLQVDLREGPCLLAYRSGEDVISADLGNDPRFPRFGPAGVEAGMAAVYSFPVRVARGVVGALNLYAADAHNLSVEEVEAAHALADIAATYLLHAAEDAGQRDLTEHLTRALDRRKVVEQASGFVAARLDVDIEVAASRLEGHAAAIDRDVVVVARDVIERRLDPADLRRS